MAICIVGGNGFAVFIELASRGPVPPHLGGYTSASKGGYVTSLACHFVHVIVQLFFLVKRRTVAGFATRPAEVCVAGDINAQSVFGVNLIATAGHAVAPS